MTSHYDAKKNCRVGTMDDKQFYAESGQKHGAYFRDLLEAWEKAGGMLRWGAGGVGLRAVVDGQEIGICFLAPAFRAKKDRIELTCVPCANNWAQGDAMSWWRRCGRRPVIAWRVPL